MDHTSIRANIIQLVHGSGGRVTVTDEDEDRFSLHLNDAVRACRLHVDVSEFSKQVKILFSQLFKWAVEHDEDVKEAILTMQEMGFILICITKRSPVSREIDDALTDLELKIANDPDLGHIPFSGQLLPPLADEDIQGFIPGNMHAWRVYPVPENPE